TGIGDVPDGAGVVVRYVFGSGGALPVSLLDFTGTLKSKTVLLNWKIASDQDLNKFIIERSADGRNFIPLQSVAAINPVSVTRNYSITDASPLPDINYYRLQMIDDDGKFTYSNIVAVRMKQDRKISIFPNPVEKILYVSATGNNENAMVEIIDANGRKLKTMNVVLAGATSFSIDVSKLPKAVYYLVLRKASGVEVHTFIKR
ncbi:MAG: T9SS type A sorting domain-containing protein, partial [Ginsengibacter sp.]